MIIDVRTHLWSNVEQLGGMLAQHLRVRRPNGARAVAGKLDAGFKAHEQAMNCVDGGLVFGFRSDRLGSRIPNELIAEFVSRDSKRRVGIAGIDPMSGDALDQIEAAVDLGLAGVTVSPSCQGFHPSHSGAMRVYERCAELELPLFVAMIDALTPGSVLEFGRPSLWEEVAMAFKSMPIIISQLGFPWIDETLVMLGKHANMYADISGVVSRPWQLYNALLTASNLGVMDKLLFASCFPFETPARAIEALYSVNSYCHGTQLPAVPRSQIRGIVERDSLSLLGIESEIVARPDAPAADEPLAVELSEMLVRRPMFRG